MSDITGRRVTRDSVRSHRQNLGLYKSVTGSKEPKSATRPAIPQSAIPDPTVDVEVDIEPYKFRETGKNTGTLIHVREVCPEGAIKTVEQVIEESGIDLAVWRVGDRIKINKWPVGAKAEKKDITWKDGRIVEGYVKADGLTVAQLWQVEVPFVRIHPEPLFPTVQPVACECDFAVPDPPVQEVGRSVIVADLHCGYVKSTFSDRLFPLHDDAVLDLALQIFAHSGANRLDVLGDMLDLSDVSDRFLQMPEYADLMQPAIGAAYRFLYRARRINESAKITVHEGNHDLRLLLALVKHMRSAYDLRPADELELPPALSLPRLLAMHKLGIEWIGGYPDDEDWLNDNTRLSHGDTARSGPGMTAKAIVESSDVNNVCGHAHRNEMASRTIHRRESRRIVQAVVVGCACHTDGRLPGAGQQDQWQNGIAVVDYDEFSFQVTMIPIEDNIAVYDGRLFKANFQGEGR